MNQKSAHFRPAPAGEARPAAPLFYSAALPGGEIIRVDILREADAAAVAELERLHFQPAWSESQIARALGQERFCILGIRADGQPAPPEKQTPFTPPAAKTALPVVDKAVAAGRSRAEAAGHAPAEKKTEKAAAARKEAPAPSARQARPAQISPAARLHQAELPYRENRPDMPQQTEAANPPGGPCLSGPAAPQPPANRATASPACSAPAPDASANQLPPGSGQTPEPLRGYISFYQTLDELEIVNIAVRSGQRRRGLGRALLEAAVQAGRQNGATRILLEVRESNAPAIALYEKCGFAQIGRRKGYYSGNNEDALLFELNLSSE